MVLYYAFDREMLNSIEFLSKDRRSQKVIEDIIENEIKTLVFFIPLNERIVISPSFRFESFLCRRVLERNREFLEQGVIAEYRHECDVKDFWLKKNNTYRSAMVISDVYREAYDHESTYKEISGMWIDRIPKQEFIGLTSRDAFLNKIKERGRKNNIPNNKIYDVLKITDETREDTFLWEMEEHMLHKYGISDVEIRKLGVREIMNQSYIEAFANQHIDICKSSLGVVDIGCTNPVYDIWNIKSVLEREGILKTILSLSAKLILYIRTNAQLQDMLEIIRRNIAKGKTIESVHKAIKKLGNVEALINKLIIDSIGDSNMNNKKIANDDILKEETLKILHLSDLHFTDQKTMEDHYFYLKMDLKNSFKLKKIDYLFISGDVCDRPEENMYQVAVAFVKDLSKDFSISIQNIILVPGNHDCNRDYSIEAYNKKGDIIDDNKYNNRFMGYNEYFYRPIKGKSYPMNPEEQFEYYIFEEDGFCVLGLNSCWEIDHKHTEKSSICMRAIQNIGSIFFEREKYVKFAIWHHPLSGGAAIQDTTFMDALANAGFKACFHGHIHEASNDLFTYDKYHSIRMVGAGTFGAVNDERGDGIPRQYNMIEFDKKNCNLIVHTRKREKDNGIWQADARWDDKNHNPKSYYIVKL